MNKVENLRSRKFLLGFLASHDFYSRPSSLGADSAIRRGARRADLEFTPGRFRLLSAGVSS